MPHFLAKRHVFLPHDASIDTFVILPPDTSVANDTFAMTFAMSELHLCSFLCHKPALGVDAMAARMEDQTQ